MTATPPPARGNRAPIFALLAANGISLIGNNLTAIAIPWFVLVTTGSAARTGLVAFASVLPAVLAAFLGGPLVDRVGNKRVSIVADLVSAVTVATIPLLSHSVGIAFWQLLILVFLGALLDAPGGTARTAMIPDLATSGQIALERANSAAQLIQSLALLLGPLLAGVMIVWLGPSNVLWLDAMTFIVSAALVWMLVPEYRVEQVASQSYREDVVAGLRVIRADALLSSMLGIAAVMNFVASPLFGVVLPVYVRERYGKASDLGLMISAVGAGSLIGALLFGVFGRRLPWRWILVGSFTLISGPVAFLALEPSLPVSIFLLAVLGIGSGSINPLALTVIQERTPVEMRGRVLGTTTAVALAAAPLGMLIAGGLTQWLGPRSIILGIAAIMLLATMTLALLPALHELDGIQPSISEAPNLDVS